MDFAARADARQRPYRAVYVLVAAALTRRQSGRFIRGHLRVVVEVALKDLEE